MKLYNSLTRKKGLVKPLKNKHISMYVCGITPYDTTHMGHAFVYITFDVLKRYLEHKNYTVNYTQNVTDIDDDILKRAKKENVDWKKLGNVWTDRFLKDLKKLNIEIPNNFVKATDYIDKMILIITDLQNKKFAYHKNGNVYFDTNKFKDYGSLSNFSRKEMVALSKERGANPEDPLKKDPLDFVLWQKSKKNEPFWKSPWGKGRPGWHIECSTMAIDTLGDQIDIHGGGKDLIYPHHESEIAQSESFTDKKPFASVWMHIGTVYCKGKKMSKSLGNLVLISNLTKKYSPDGIRLLLLSKGYRNDWEFAEKDLARFDGIVMSIKNFKSVSKKPDPNIMKKFEAFMDDDLSTKDLTDYLISLIKMADRGNEDVIPSILRILSILGFDLKKN